MTIVVVGLNYRTAPIELREMLTLAGDTMRIALDALHIPAVGCALVSQASVTHDPCTLQCIFLATTRQ